MKHVCMSVSILTLILVFTIFSAHHTSNLVTRTSDLLDEAVEARRTGDLDTSLHLVQAASSHWKDHEEYFGAVLRHDEIDTVIGEFARLESYARSQDQDDFYSNCAALLSELEHIEQMEWPFFHNIL